MAEKRPTLEQMWLTLDWPGFFSGRSQARDPLRYETVRSLLSGLGCVCALVEFFVVPDCILIFVIRTGDSQPTMIEWPCSSAQLEFLVSTYRRELVQYPRYGTDQRWLELTSPLLQDVLPELQGVDLVYLIPHKQLSYLPLHALRVNGAHLIDRFPIVYAPSAEMFTRIQGRLATSGLIPRLESVLVAGNPTFDLEYAEKEAQWVADYFGVRPYLGREATKIKIRSELSGKGLIHMACHGFFHSSEPLESGLLMAGKRTLNVKDIDSVRIRADLVTLSCCEGSLADPYDPGEPTGLAIAFLESGVSSVLGTLWSVVDETTASLTSDFYQRLYDRAGNKINSKARALQQAMLTVRDQKGHPYYWAAFMLTGSWQ